MTDVEYKINEAKNRVKDVFMMVQNTNTKTDLLVLQREVGWLADHIKNTLAEFKIKQNKKPCCKKKGKEQQ